MNFKLPTANYQLPTGFTLVEAMVAVTILTLSVAGPLVTANRAIVAAQTARDRLVASYLAQEGIEYIRSIRDDEYLAVYPGDTSSVWGAFLQNIAPCETAQGCILVDPANGAGFVEYTGDAPLYRTTNGMYTQDSTVTNTLTPFTRTVQAVQRTATDERITSTVSWKFHGTDYSVSVIDHL